MLVDSRGNIHVTIKIYPPISMGIMNRLIRFKCVAKGYTMIFNVDPRKQVLTTKV